MSWHHPWPCCPTVPFLLRHPVVALPPNTLLVQHRNRPGGYTGTPSALRATHLAGPMQGGCVEPVKTTPLALPQCAGPRSLWSPQCCLHRLWGGLETHKSPYMLVQGPTILLYGGANTTQQRHGMTAGCLRSHQASDTTQNARTKMPTSQGPPVRFLISPATAGATSAGRLRHHHQEVC